MLKGLLASQYPVEILAADSTGCFLVTGGQHEVRVWGRKTGPQLQALGPGGVSSSIMMVTHASAVSTFFTVEGVGDWVSLGDLPPPPISSATRNYHVVVAAVQWLSSDLVLVSYLNHGVI